MPEASLQTSDQALKKTEWFPLTAAQSGLWFAQMVDSKNPTYCISELVDIPCNLNVVRFEAALRALVRETEALRVEFSVEDEQTGVVSQRIGPGPDWELEFVDCSGVAAPIDRARDWMDARLSSPMRLPGQGGGAAFEFALIRIADDRFQWFQRYHHAVVDGVTVAMLQNRLAQLYDDPADTRAQDGPGLRDLVLSDLEYTSGALQERDRQYWLAQRGERDEPVSLSGSVRGRADSQRRRSREMGDRLMAEINGAVRETGCAPHAVLASVLALYLSRMSGGDEVTLGFPVHGRTDASVRGVPGMVSNVVPLRIDLRPDMTPRRLISHVSEQMHGALKHQRYRYEAMRRDRHLLANDQRLVGPHVNVLLAAQPLSFDGVTATVRNLVGGPVEDLSLVVNGRSDDGRVQLELHANADLYSNEDLEAHCARLHRLTGELIRELDERTLSLIDIATEAELHWTRSVEHGPEAAIPDGTVVDLFQERVRESPDSIALSEEDRSLTYDELNRRANRLARFLVERGAGPDRIVALALPRTNDTVVALLAVLKTGAAYLPIDPSLPDSRVRVMLEDARPALGLTTTARSGSLPDEVTTWWELDGSAVHGAADLEETDLTDDDRSAPLLADHPAYVIFTSGSTGRPKGVVVAHLGLTDLTRWAGDVFGPVQRVGVLLSTSLSFDVSAFELFGPLCSGGRVEIVDDLLSLTEEGTNRWVGGLISGVPSALTQVLANEEVRVQADQVVLAGEGLSVQALGDISASMPGAMISNIYGPTECTVYATAWYGGRDPVRQTPPPIGRPLPNTGAHVLDRCLRQVPPGAIGELYLSGPRLVRGYLDRPGLTSERFVANPFGAPGERMYRTGDLVRRDTAGEIEYLGRSDQQVKLRGYRIEIGEIESLLHGHPDVATAVVTVHEDSSGTRRLVGYLQPRPGVDLDVEAVREMARDQLPEYMVPAVLMPLETLPLNTSGKLDRRALPAPTFEGGTSTREPLDEIETRLCEAFATVLGVSDVGVEDNFFELGGDSIVSIQLVNEARKAGLRLAPRDVFEAKTVAGLAELVRSASEHSIQGREGIGAAPLLPIASAFVETSRHTDGYCQSVLIRLPVGITLRQLNLALNAVVDRHEVLRSQLVKDDEESYLYVNPPEAIPRINLISRVGVDTGQRHRLSAIVPSYLETERDRISPEDGAMLSAVWFDTGVTESSRLLLVVHHLAVDGVSWRILLTDLATAWQAIAQDRRPELEPVGTSVRGWAEYLSSEATAPSRVEELPVWRELLHRERRPLAPRPLDPVVDTFATRRTFSFRAPVPRTRALLNDIPRNLHVNSAEVLLAVLGAALLAWRSRHDPEGADFSLLVDLEAHGREEIDESIDLSRTVGWLTSLFPVEIGFDPQTRVEGEDFDGETVAAILRSIKEQLRSHRDHGLGYGLLRYLNPETAAELSDAPRAEVLFNYLGRVTGEGATPGQAWTPDLDVLGLNATAQDAVALSHALEINAFIDESASGPILHTHWSWATELFSEAGIAELARLWSRALEKLMRYSELPGVGKHTASDFPLVRIDQAAIDEIEYRFPTVEDVLPLTSLQEGLLFHALYAEDGRAKEADDGSGVYMMQFGFVLEGVLDPDAMKAATDTLLRRHDTLRSVFCHQGLDRPVRVVLTDHEVEWQERDYSAHSQQEADERVRQFLTGERTRPFDLAERPAIRCALIRTGEDQHWFVLTNHHILLDGWSMPLLAKELFQLYVLHGDGQSLPRPVHSCEYLKWLARQDREAARRAWREELAGLDRPVLVRDTAICHANRPELAGADPERVETRLSKQLTADLADVARAHDVTLNALVQGAWAILLSWVTGREDVTFGATVSGRPADLPGMDRFIGLLINTVPVRSRLDLTASLAENIVALRDAQVALLPYQYMGLPEIQRLSGHEELFDTLVVFENYPIDSSALRLRGTELEVRDIVGYDATHYPLSLVVTPGDRMHLRLDHLPEFVEVETAQMLLRRLERIFTALVEDVSAPLNSLEPVDEEEQENLRLWNSTEHDFSDATLADLLEKAAERHPSRTALIYEDVELTYAELTVRTNRLANLLLTEGVRPGDVVAVIAPRGVELVVALRAILIVGAAYLPIDPDYPQDRIDFILEDAEPSLLLTVEDTDHVTTAPVPRLVLDSVQTGVALEWHPDDAPGEGEVGPITPGHSAYVIYTSGSTGRPKGVSISHRSIVNRLEWMQDRFPLDGSDRVLQKTPSGFDVSVWEFFWAHMVGAGLVLARPDGHRDPAYLAELIQERSVTTMHFVPSMLGTFLAHLEDDRAERGRIRSLRRVMCSGEALGRDLVRRFHALVGPGTGLHNLYGPTEAAVDVTWWDCGREIDSSAAVPLGGPIWNTRLHVLDTALRQVGPGVVGELYLAGVQLSNGYLGRPALTSERFVANPFGAPGERMYRTGDLASWRPDGTLDFLGRVDHQVKVRGLRIELGEIEAVVGEHRGVAETAVIARQDQPGTTRLVAYVVPRDESTEVPEGLREHLARRLPDYMVPSAFIPLPALPLTPNGKLDRRALPAPDFAAEVSGRAPTTEVETRLCALFAEVLDLPEVGVDDAFFDLGGDSILAIQLVGQARRSGIILRPRQVFELRTPAALAVAAQAAGVRAIAEDSGIGRFPLPPLSRWLMGLPTGGSGFHQTVVLSTPTGMDGERLTMLMEHLLTRHHALRMRLVDTETGEVPEEVPDASTVIALHEDVTGLSEDELTERIAEWSGSASGGLDPWKGVNLRAAWFDRGPEHPGRLVLVAHHLVVDGVSWRVMAADLETAWTSLVESGRPEVVPTGTSYARWALDGAELARHPSVVGELPAWLRITEGWSDVLGTGPLEADQDTAGTLRTLVRELDSDTTEAVLGTVPALYHAGVDDVLLAGLSVAVATHHAEHSGTSTTPAILIDLEGHGRKERNGLDTPQDLTETVGWFTSLYPVRVEVADLAGGKPASLLSGGAETGSLLKSVKEQLRSVPADGSGYGLLRYLNEETASLLAAEARPQIGFNYLGRFTQGSESAWGMAPEASGLTGGADPDMPVPHVLEINAFVREEKEGERRLSVNLAWPGRLLDDDTVARITDTWFEALRAFTRHAQDPSAGGHTPSDLAATLSQEEIDDFEAEMKNLEADLGFDIDGEGGMGR